MVNIIRHMIVYISIVVFVQLWADTLLCCRFPLPPLTICICTIVVIFRIVVSVGERYVIIDLGFKKPQTTFTLRIKAQILYVFWLLELCVGRGGNAGRWGGRGVGQASERYWTTTKVNKRLHTGRMDMDTPFSFHFIPFHFDSMCAATAAVQRKIKKKK